MSCAKQYYKKINGEWELIQCERKSINNTNFCGYHNKGKKINQNIKKCETIEDRMMKIPVKKR